jgi:exoribonuclease R
MVRRVVSVTGPDAASVAALQASFDQVRAKLSIPADFPAAVLDAARASAAAGPVAPVDLREVPFITIDPPGSTDLDQAMYLAATGDGYRVDYAIADVPAFVPDGGPVDAEARHRGQTLYAPDQRTPLHPAVLSEGAASLLEGQDRPAFVWRFSLDGAGRVTATDLVHGMVRNRHRLSYDEVQAVADAHPDARPGAAPGSLPEDDVTGQAVLLRAVGGLRMALEEQRGGANLPLPEQEVQAENGRYTLRLRPAPGCCAPCRRPTRERWRGSVARPPRSGWTGRTVSPTATCCAGCAATSPGNWR